MTSLACALAGVHNERIALSDVTVEATLQDMLCEVTTTQTYRNLESVNIKAVYTFPLPPDAVLLDLRIHLGERTLQGVVVEKKSAEAQYERAIDRGDSAVMLQQLESGMYTMNVGNLMAGETARIVIRYALTYRWSDDRLRLLIPTTIAPRYGESPHEPHQVPQASIAVENRFSLAMRVVGLLRSAHVASPSHDVHLTRGEDATTITFAQPSAVMDRDFVLQLRPPGASRGFALVDQDGAGSAALVSFQPFFHGLRRPRPLSLAIVLDCSGSMAGDSVAQARRALDTILESLQPDDRVTIVAFGSGTRAMSERLVPCTARNVERARHFARALDADMGGTEIEQALREAYAAIGVDGAGEVFLVTDGQVGDWMPAVKEARRAGHRVFAVGVGTAVTESFLRQLADATGGACELVSPREGMAERVVRHFERMRAPRARAVRVHWPEGARDVAPEAFTAVFEGDTVVASARFDAPVRGGRVVLEVETAEGEIGRQKLQLSEGRGGRAADGISTLARIAAGHRMRTRADANTVAVALRYRLSSEWTHWLAIVARAEGEGATELPALRTVPQTLAAGWGGSGGVMYCRTEMSVDAAPDMERDMPPITHRMRGSASGPLFSPAPPPPPMSPRNAPRSFGMGDVDMPMPSFGRSHWDAEVDALVALVNADPSRLTPASAIALLDDAGLLDAHAGILHLAQGVWISEAVVAGLLVQALLSGWREDALTPEASEALDRLRGEVLPELDKLRDRVKGILAWLKGRGDERARMVGVKNFVARLQHQLETAVRE